MQLAIAALTGLLALAAFGLWRTPPKERWLLGMRRPIRALLAKRLGGFVHPVNAPDPAKPLTWSGDAPPRIAVIGAGLAGLAAADLLATRGLRVVVFEKESYVGGKMGSWPVTLSNGDRLQVCHGFHAYFHHYHNLWAWFDDLGVTDRFVTIQDYEILRPDGRKLGFANTETLPVVNLVDLWRQGLYRAGDILGTDAMHEMDAFLRYDPVATYRRYDHVSYEEFAKRNALPESLSLIFDSFSRAFFADPDRMSTAELIKSFHFYYLGHDGGLRYDYPTDDYEHTLLRPIRDRLAARGAELRLAHPVADLQRDGARWLVDGEPFDEVVLAAPVPAARPLLAGCRALADHPAYAARLARLSAGQRYAVLRLWLDRDVRADVTEFAIVDRVVVLDAISIVHRIEAESREWVARRGGGVVELHCYAVPDHLTDDRAVRDQLVAELHQFFPEVADAVIVDEFLQVRQDFPAFHVGAFADRPEVATPLEGLHLAGDWVKLPFPAMLMEAAVSAGRLAANRVLAGRGLREEPLLSVPPRGLLADLPEPPKPPHIRERFEASERAWDSAATRREQERT